MSRAWRPIALGGAIVVATFALAQAQIFAPSTPAETGAAGDAMRGEAIFQGECSGGHGDGGTGGAGPALVGTGLGTVEVAAVVQQGRGIMPGGLVTGQEQADVVAYVVSISGSSE